VAQNCKVVLEPHDGSTLDVMWDVTINDLFPPYATKGEVMIPNSLAQEASNHSNHTFKFVGDYHSTPLGSMMTRPSHHDYETPCWVRLRIGRDFDLSGLSITVPDAENHVGDAPTPNHVRIQSFLQKMDNSRAFDHGKDGVRIRGPLIVRAGKESVLHVHLRHTAAEFMDVTGHEGLVHLENVTVDDQFTGIAVALEIGDVDIMPNTQEHAKAELEWSQPCGYVCLPAGHWINETEADCDYPVVNGTNATTEDYWDGGGSEPLQTNSNNGTGSEGNSTDLGEEGFVDRACQARTCTGVNKINLVGYGTPSPPHTHIHTPTPPPVSCSVLSALQMLADRPSLSPAMLSAPSL